MKALFSLRNLYKYMKSLVKSPPPPPPPPCVIFLFFCLFVPPAFSGKGLTEASSSFQVRTINTWNIKIYPRELDRSTVLSNKTLLMLNGPIVGSVLFASMDCPSFALSSAHQQIKKWGGYTKGAKILKSSTSSVLLFRSKDSLHWLSTDGACLIANTDHLTNQKYKRLRKRVSRSVN